MMNEKNKGNWSALAAEARRADAPNIDVRHAVMAEIRQCRTADEPHAPLSLLAEVDALMTRSWMRPALALAAAVACGIGYSGYRGSALMDMVSALMI